MVSPKAQLFRNAMFSALSWPVFQTLLWLGRELDYPAKEFVQKMFSGAKEGLGPMFSTLIQLGKGLGGRCKDLSLPDNGSFLSRSRVRADQVGDKNANRSGTGSARYKNTQTLD
jgi:hypothetical protein